MPYFVNDELVPEDLIRRESGRLQRDPHWQSIPDPAERARQLRAAAEQSAIDCVLLAQSAVQDPRPIEADALRQEMARLREQWGGQVNIDESGMRDFVERQLRVTRTTNELCDEAPKPTSEEIEAFYRAHQENFRRPEMFRAAHIVKYVNQEQNEVMALAGLQLALEELEAGDAFAMVADRRSDCQDKGGDLGQFPSGYMVPEFEDVLRSLAVGERSGIFRTPFGFHIAELRGRNPVGQADLQDVSRDIERVLTFAKRHETYTRRMAELRDKAQIRWVPGPGFSQAAP